MLNLYNYKIHIEILETKPKRRFFLKTTQTQFFKLDPNKDLSLQLEEFFGGSDNVNSEDIKKMLASVYSICDSYGPEATEKTPKPTPNSKTKKSSKPVRIRSFGCVRSRDGYLCKFDIPGYSEKKIDVKYIPPKTMKVDPDSGFHIVAENAIRGRVEIFHTVPVFVDPKTVYVSLNLGVLSIRFMELDPTSHEIHNFEVKPHITPDEE